MERDGPEFWKCKPSSPDTHRGLSRNKIIYHVSCYKSKLYKSDKFKHIKSLTDWNAEWKKAEALDHVVSYIIKHKELNPGSVDINQKYVEYLSELGIL